MLMALNTCQFLIRVLTELQQVKDHKPSMDILGVSNAPEALAARMSLGSLGNPHIKKEPDQSLAQIWETQWQEFLKTMESPEPGLEVPDLPEKSPPWDDAKAFLDSFEQVARVFQWPKDEWVARLLPTLSRDTVEAFSRLEDVDREDYEKLKMTILQGDAMSREVSRQHFRHFCYREVEGPRETYGRLEEFCYRWLKPKSHSKEQILELLILEQFVAILPPEIQSWVKENNPENNARVVLLAEDFILKQRLSGTQQQQSFRILEKRAGEPVGVSWEPEGASHELSESQAEAAVNLQAAERAPSDAGQGLQLCREIKREGDSDLSDHGNISEDEELNQPPENSKQAEPQGQSVSDDGPQYFDDRETSETLHIPKEEEIHVAEGGHEFIHSERQKTPEDTRVFMQVLRSYQSIRASKRPFQCLECGKDFAHKRNLSRHQRIHTGETPYKCPDCGMCFMWDASLSVHRRRSHAGEKPAVDTHETLYICCECGDSFSGKRDLDIHQRSHAGEAEESFSGTGELDVHQRSHAGETHTGEEPFKLADCGENFTWRSSFERHRKIHTGKKPALLARKRTHAGEKKYKCTLCGTGFFKLWQLRKHQLIHTGENPYQCSDCGKSFMWSSSLERHRKDHAKEGPQNIPCVQEKNHPCSKCGKSLQTASQLRRHKCIQAGERKGNDGGESFILSASPNQRKKLNMGNNAAPFLDKALLGERRPKVCSDCGRRFQCLSHLKRHQRLHTGERPHKCDDCGESFMWSSTLERHTKTHAKERRLQKAPSGKEKSHVRTKCGESLQSADLRRHQSSHTRETRHKCMDCGESFMRSTSLESHRKNHAKERRLQKMPSVKEEAHVCSKCGKSLRSASKLKIHQRIHTGERPCKCNDCGESFMWSTSLHRHKKRFHKGKDAPKMPPVNKKCHMCSVCGKSFNKSSHLKRHQLIHTGERPYKCNVCGKGFTQSPSLNQHMKWHNNGKKVPPLLPKTPPVKRERHMCSVCGMNFKDVSRLKSHQGIHTGETTSMYQCNCGKSFVWESSLQRHKRQHHKRKKVPLVLQEESPFQRRRHLCSVCGKGFDGPSRLIKHQLIHTKEKPYKCSQCWKSYFHKDSLSRHKKVHAEFVKRP